MAGAAKVAGAQRFIVTGANRGLGLEFTRQLLARGDRVIAGCRQPARALRLTEFAAAHPGHLHIVPLDLDKERSIASFAREASMISDACDVLINCAGVLVSGERFGELTAKTFDESLRSNVTGPLLLSQALAPQLAHSVRAKIVNLSSELGSLADTTHFHTPSYAISKAALNMVTRLLAAQLKSAAIAVVSVHPGWVRTDMGGQSAPLAVADSVDGVLRVVDALTPEDSGRFFDYRGEELAW